MCSMHLYPLKVYKAYQRMLAEKQRNNEVWTPTISVTAPRASVPAMIPRHEVQLTSSSLPVDDWTCNLP